MARNIGLKRRIIDLSYKHKASHIGSCLTAVDIIDEIFKEKKPFERFVLSSGHMAMALYVVLEKYLKIDAEQLYIRSGTHPDVLNTIQLVNGEFISPIDCSTGSLGHGLPIALGMALADPSKNVYCLVSDGEMSEGSMYEALRIMSDLGVKNLKVYVNINGFGAYSYINVPKMWDFIELFNKQNNIFVRLTNSSIPGVCTGLLSHYKVLSEEDYNILKELI